MTQNPIPTPQSDPQDLLLEIQPAQFPRDLATIQTIAREAWHATFADISTPEFIAHELEREYSEQGISAQLAENHQYIIIYRETIPLGYAAYQHLPNEDKTKLHKLYLLPDCKRQGLGGKLMNQVELEAQKTGLDHVELLVNRDNPSIAFYQKKGYEIVGELDTPIGTQYWRNDYIMRKALKSCP